MTGMSLWQRILRRFDTQAAAILRTFEPTPPTDTVAFSISFIALAANLAKADGLVTSDEVAVFRCIFEIPPEEERNAAQVFDLCRQESGGFEVYARKMARAFRTAPHGDKILVSVLDGLFHIAMADGQYREAEAECLARTTEILGLEQDVYLHLKARHVPDARDPFRILGLSCSASDADLRADWRSFVRDNYPDRFVAHGLPAEMSALANARVADANAACAEIRAMRARSEGLSASNEAQIFYGPIACVLADRCIPAPEQFCATGGTRWRSPFPKVRRFPSPRKAAD